MKAETNDSGTLTFERPQNKIKIQTIDLTAKEWFDKTAGNSYFSARMVINWQLPGEQTIYLPFQYGYGDHYKDVAMNELIKRKLIPEYDTDAHRIALWRYCDENKIILRYDKHERCLKREVVAFGQE